MTLKMLILKIKYYILKIYRLIKNYLLQGTPMKCLKK